jgi:tRNA pseudouridine32 synthase / 23S rRNA pseudouridine746 synthase
LSKHRPPVIEGLAASTLQLPRGSWATVLDCLSDHFAHVSRVEWVSRLERGRVVDELGRAVGPSTAFSSGARIYYYREVPAETPIPFTEQILHADDHLLVADKPHFLPVTPAGQYVRETLLARLVRRTGNPDLAPLHRIDRATAGLVVFSVKPESRAAYQSLFRERLIKKRYVALAGALPALEFPHIRATRIVRGEPFIVSTEVPGIPNSETRIEVEERTGSAWRYALYPVTGKKHQLRVHLCALGAPIVHDELYPRVALQAADDFSRPLKLLAQGLEFPDPLTGEVRRFTSRFEI